MNRAASNGKNHGPAMNSCEPGCRGSHVLARDPLAACGDDEFQRIDVRGVARGPVGLLEHRPGLASVDHLHAMASEQQ